MSEVAFRNSRTKIRTNDVVLLQ